MKSKRQALQAQRRRKKTITRVIIGGVALLAVALVVFFASSAARPAVGQEVPVMPDINHVAEGTDPGPYNSNPPTSGRHYPTSLKPGFYNEGDVQDPYPEGLLVHSLEHGYVIFWYNCEVISEQECTTLRDQIQGVMDRANNNKVIAYPWTTTDVPVTLTSWGRLMSFERFDPEQAYDFVLSNRNKAPEPHAE